nr:MAG TPA: hypothetical protein [Caudoviricetes sp.]
MKLTTKKTLIVFYDNFDEIYRFCGIRYFKDNYNDKFSTPILYTDSIRLARDIKNKLNKELRA